MSTPKYVTPEPCSFEAIYRQATNSPPNDAVIHRIIISFAWHLIAGYFMYQEFNQV